MTYKNIFLSALLVPMAIVSNNSTDLCMQQLKNDRFEKELELSNLGKIVAEKQELIESMALKAKTIMAEVCEGLNEQEKAELIEREIDGFIKRCKENFAIKNDVKSFFTNELCGEGENGDAFGIVKFFMIRYDFERALLKDFIQRYEKCLRELLQINNEIDELQK